jgi:hypothetical protein
MGRATEEFMVRQRSMCGKPLYLTLDLISGMALEVCGVIWPGYRFPAREGEYRIQ